MAVARFENKNVPVQDVLDFLASERKTMRELCITGLLNDDAMECLSNVLRQNTSLHLQVLKLPRNFLTASSCNSLAHVIQSLSYLRELDVSDNKLGEFNDDLLLPRRESNGSMSSHQSSNRKRSSLTGDGLAKLVETLSLSSCELVTLQLNNNKLGPKATTSLTALIRRASSIRHLALANNSLGTKTIKTLLPPLLQNSWLKSLDLSYNHISDRGASLLAEVLNPEGSSQSRLQELNLTYNKIGPAGAHSIARALMTNRTLRKLDLSLNRIGPEGAEYFGPVLKYSHTLQELIMSRNNIGEGGSGVLRLLEGLEAAEGTSLRRLDLSWNSLSDEAALQLARILSGNSILKSLNLASNAIGTRGVVALAVSLDFDLGLEELNIVGNQADDRCTEALAKVLCRPRSANFTLLWQKNNFSIAGKLRLEAALMFRQNMATWLGRCLRDIERHRVVSLDLEGFVLGDDELVSLAAHLSNFKPRVKVLRVAGELITGRGALTLARTVIAPNVVDLERVYLQRTSIKDYGSAALAQAVLTNTSLRILSLVSCDITSMGAQTLANAIRRNSHLQMVTLQDNAIGDEGARDILASVLDKQNPSVTSLNLSQCNITDYGLVLPTTIICLEALYLGQNRITDAGALDLAKACIGCKSLKWLDVSCNKLTWKGIQTIQIFLPTSSVLLSENQMTNGSL